MPAPTIRDPRVCNIRHNDAKRITRRSRHTLYRCDRSGGAAGSPCRRLWAAVDAGGVEQVDASVDRGIHGRWSIRPPWSRGSWWSQFSGAAVNRASAASKLS
jgi:hypothetical protein